MSTLSPDATPAFPPPLRLRPVGELAATVPGATRLFRRYKLDFCCNGDLPLGEAAAAKGLDLFEIEKALGALTADLDEHPTDTEGLIAHIIARYHETHRRDPPELIRLARRVESVHHDNPRAPKGLANLLAAVEAELIAHMSKEEKILFPIMAEEPTSPLLGIIDVMRAEHEQHGAYLLEMERLTGGFIAPDEACNSWRSLLIGTSRLYEDVIQHVHLENKVLFPRFVPADAGSATSG